MPDFRPQPTIRPRLGATITRRLSVLAAAAAALVAPRTARAAQTDATNATVAALIARADQANLAFMRGDMTRWYEIAGPIAPDFTLMHPFGGSASHGFNGTPERLREMAQMFAGGGQAVLEIDQTYATPDMVVLVFVERQTGLVGGLPLQDWSLRVTQVWRRRGEVWDLVHRHADPLTHKRDLERTAVLARGA